MGHKNPARFTLAVCDHQPFVGREFNACKTLILRETSRRMQAVSQLRRLMLYPTELRAPPCKCIIPLMVIPVEPFKSLAALAHCVLKMTISFPFPSPASIQAGPAASIA